MHPPSSTGVRTTKVSDKEIFRRQEMSRSHFGSSKNTRPKLEPINKSVRVESSNYRKQEAKGEKPPPSNLYRVMHPNRKQQRLPMPLGSYTRSKPLMNQSSGAEPVQIQESEQV